jgi:hypothetical protein
MNKKKLTKIFSMAGLIFLSILSSFWFLNKENEFSAMEIAPTRNGIYGREESSYFLLVYLEEEHTIQKIKNIRNMIESFTREKDQNGFTLGDEEFDETAFWEDGVYFIYNDEKQAFDADIGVYIVNYEDYPQILNTWDVQYFPEYRYLTTTEETRSNERQEREKEVLYMSMGVKSPESLKSEMLLVENYGVPDGEGRIERFFIEGTEENRTALGGVSFENVEKTEDEVIFTFWFYLMEEGEVTLRDGDINVYEMLKGGELDQGNIENVSYNGFTITESGESGLVEMELTVEYSGEFPVMTIEIPLEDGNGDEETVRFDVKIN